jgi:hypothetical protein
LLLLAVGGFAFKISESFFGKKYRFFGLLEKLCEVHGVNRSPSLRLTKFLCISLRFNKDFDFICLGNDARKLRF